jgi:hypothetical protein
MGNLDGNPPCTSLGSDGEHCFTCGLFGIMFQSGRFNFNPSFWKGSAMENQWRVKREMIGRLIMVAHVGISRVVKVNPCGSAEVVDADGARWLIPADHFYEQVYALFEMDNS